MKRKLWIIICGLIFLVVLSQFLLYKSRFGKQLNVMRERLMATASYAARSIDSDLIFKIPLKRAGDTSVEYKIVFQKLTDIKAADPSIKYVYIMTATDEPGILQYVVDATPLPEIVTARSPSSFPGDKYDARRLPQMLDAFKGPTADRDFTKDEWGVTISGYAPIRDAGGKAAAILGVDMDARYLYARQKTLQKLFLVLLLSIILLLTWKVPSCRRSTLF